MAFQSTFAAAVMKVGVNVVALQGGNLSVAWVFYCIYLSGCTLVISKCEWL